VSNRKPGRCRDQVVLDLAPARTESDDAPAFVVSGPIRGKTNHVRPGNSGKPVSADVDDPRHGQWGLHRPPDHPSAGGHGRGSHGGDPGRLELWSGADRPPQRVHDGTGGAAFR